MLDEYKDILTVKDLKEVLHYSSNTTIYKMLNSGEIKAVHTNGNKWLIPKQNVINYLAGNNKICYNIATFPNRLPE